MKIQTNKEAKEVIKNFRDLFRKLAQKLFCVLDRRSFRMEIFFRKNFYNIDNRISTKFLKFRGLSSTEKINKNISCLTFALVN